MTDRQPAGRPRGVVVALALIAATLAASLIGPVRLLTTPSADVGRQSPTVVAVWVLIFIALGFALLAALAHRRRWAYYLWVAGLAFTVLYGVAGLARSLASSPFDAVYVTLILAAHGAALVLLLSRPAREWLGIGAGRVAAPPLPAEWRADPAGRHQWRYWNGADWTEHVADDGVPGVDHLEAQVDGLA